uniref:Galectin domain-containing protein n=1 Tax=Macrostomum lignano TaxID=282301 RepID=A0A1I8J927_9PLAT
SADLAEETEESVLARKLQQGTDAEQRDESIGAEVDDIKNLVKHLDQDVDEVRIEYEDQQISMELQEASSGQEKASSDLEKGTNEISFPSEAIDIVRCLEFNDNPNTSVPSYIYAKPTIKEGMDPMSKLDFTCLDDTSTDISNRTPAAAGVENVTFQTERSVKGLLDRNLAEESDKSTASHASQNSPEFEGASPLSETASLDQNHSLSVHTVTQGGFQPEHIESEEEKTCFKDAHSEDKPFDSNTNSSVVDTVSPSSTVSHYYDNQPSRKSYSLEESNSPRSNNENLRDSSPLSNDSKLSNDKALVQTEVQQAELKQEQAENSSDPELNAIEISAATTAHEISLPKVLDGTPTLVRQECESRESLQSVIESASSAAEGADTGTRGQLDDVVQQPGRLSASEDEDSEADNDEPPYFFDGGSIAANQTNATLNSKWTEQSKLRDGRSPEPIGPNTHVEEADHHAIMSNGTDVMISTLAKMPGANQKPSRAQDAANEAFNSPSGDGPRAGSDRELSNSLQFGDGSHGDTLEFQLTNESAIEDLERRKNAKGFSTLKPIIPFRARLPVQIRYGHSIVIYGRMTNYSSAGLKLSLENLDYSPGAQAFELLISFPGGADQPSLMHTCQLIGGQPVCEAKALLSPKQNDEFRLVICFKRLGLSTALADTECVLPHHIPVSDFTHLVLHPDCEYTSVEFHERLELPLREHLACPLSLVESVRLGLRPDSSSTGLLFGLADGAAMTCSLSIASLTATVGRADPDDTCSSNGGDDGGGFVKEMEKRGLNQLAKLRSVLLTIHGQVVRIHINGEYIMTYLMKLDARRVKSLYIEGDLMLEDFKIKEMRANPLTALPKQLPVGGQIRIWARLLPSAASMPAGNNCRISLRTGADPSSADFALLARVAPSRESDSGAVGCLALSAIVNGQQSDEAVDATSRSDAKDRDGFAFETTIVRRLKDFYVVLDSGHNASLRHRIDPDLVTHLHLAGAATAFLFVSFPASLWLPYTNRLPPMDPSRPGRLIRLGLSDGADLAETDGGNYGASRTVSLAIGADPDGVKPLICEFCLTDSGQQAALAWMNDARQTRVAELCPVPLFSEIRTIDLLLADNGDCKLVVNKRIVSSYRADISPKDARWIVITGNISLLNVELENQSLEQNDPTTFCGICCQMIQNRAKQLD